VRSYPIVEKHRLLWVWPGDAAAADPALVPDWHWADPGQALRNLNIDAGSLWARRLIDGMLAREREPRRAAQS
jgi:phenylpropionate dioxygenase-like ring-hydroxylating dioxygenase large terminal subunit